MSDAVDNTKVVKIAHKYRLGEQPTDFAYWQTQSYEARLTALEQIRQEYHRWKNDPQPRHPRFYPIVKR